MQKLNTTAVYILSVIGFIGCCFAGLGWIPALIALIIANNGLKKYNADPSQYDNGKAMKSARTVAIIALVLSAIVFIASIIFLLSFDGECDFWNWYLEQAGNNPGVTEEQLAPVYQRMEEAGCM